MTTEEKQQLEYLKEEYTKCSGSALTLMGMDKLESFLTLLLKEQAA